MATSNDIIKRLREIDAEAQTGEEFELETTNADLEISRRERLAPFIKLNREMAINPSATVNESKLNRFLDHIDDLLGLD